MRHITVNETTILTRSGKETAEKSIVFEKIILENSSNQEDFEKAKHEWEIISADIDPEQTYSCICGQKHLKYLYRIRNKINNKTLGYIGNDCIKKFRRTDMNAKLSAFQKECTLVKFCAENGLYIDWPQQKHLFSVSLIERIYNKGGFKPTQYNHYDPKVDYEFFLRMFRKRDDASPNELKRVRAILATQIKPYIRETDYFKKCWASPDNTLDDLFEEPEAEPTAVEVSLADTLLKTPAEMLAEKLDVPLKDAEQIKLILKAARLKKALAETYAAMDERAESGLLEDYD